MPSTGNGSSGEKVGNELHKAQGQKSWGTRHTGTRHKAHGGRRKGRGGMGALLY